MRWTPVARPARRVSPLPCSSERVAPPWLASSDLQLQQTANCPHKVRQETSRCDARQIQETLLRCPHRQFYRDTQPAITSPSPFALPPSQRLSPWAPITHNASPTVLRLQFSERNAFSAASMGLDPAVRRSFDPVSGASKLAAQDYCGQVLVRQVKPVP